jgi:LmbE family N-acetylglucosaminyl deacetylase
VSLLLFRKEKIKELIHTVVLYIRGHEKLKRKIEYIRGLYRHPRKMVGRKLQINYTSHTDVLVIGAHPDDDVLGLGTTMYRHSLKGDNIKVIFVTNGSGRFGQSWRMKVSDIKRKSEIRYSEAVQALSLINIPKENILCLGYPDAGIHRYLINLSVDILMLIQKLSPGRIYVHCIEGGHSDHDVTSFVVKLICNKIGYSNVFEWVQYNPKQPLGTLDVKFLPTKSTELKGIQIDISKEERLLKRKMLASHNSQDVEQFFLQGEAIRQADISNLEMELYENGELPKEKLFPLVKELNNYMIKLKKGKLINSRQQ